MKLIIRILLNAIMVFVLAEILPGINITGYLAAIVVAVVISLLNILVKPILVVLTFPITVITFGLFMLFINAFIIYIADVLIDSFSVSSIWMALLFSLLLSIIQSITYSFLNKE
ncbi:MAG: phage holin family protein [Aestuariibaculum sp.]